MNIKKTMMSKENMGEVERSWLEREFQKRSNEGHCTLFPSQGSDRGTRAVRNTICAVPCTSDAQHIGVDATHPDLYIGDACGPHCDMSKDPALKLPYAQQFSPEQTPLQPLLGILRQNAGRSTLKAGIASAFFKTKTDPQKLAGNTIIALKSFGILDENGSLTEFGSELIALQGSAVEAHKLLARRIVLHLNGLALLETLREMETASLKIELTTLPAELEKRGFVVSKNSSDLSGVLGWLRKGGVLDGYRVNPTVYQSFLGASMQTLEATKGLDKEQIAFLRSLNALNVTDWTPYNQILKHAEALYPGEIRFSWKDVVARICRPLEKAGLIEFRKKSKEDKKTPEGRGGKVGDVKPTAKFQKEFAEPLLLSLYKAAGYKETRLIRGISLRDLVNAVKNERDTGKRGKSLEWLAIRICQLLDLDFMGWQERDPELAGGGEVDAIMHSARLVYSRWQVQCKVGGITLQAVAKEVGMQTVSLANVILMVSTGKATASAQIFRRKQISSTNLNIVFIDGDDLEKIVNDNSSLVEILQKQAQDALALKPRSAGLTEAPPSESCVSPATYELDEEQNAPSKLSDDSSEGGSAVQAAYATNSGRMYCGDGLTVLPHLIACGYRAKLICTSPPFALVKKKEYGNEDSDSYVRWFEQFIPLFKEILDPQGSLVIDIGGAWIKGLPAKSTYHLKLLLKLCESGFYLAQDFYHYNPARLPTPAEWVTVRRLRVKDAINNVWWLTLDPFIKVDNRRVLAPYSESMKALIKNGYKPALRPSGHDISDKFQRDNGGSIPPNLLEFSNTESNSYYLRRCKETGLKPHPARFPQALPDFFIRFLTDENDLVLDPFAGSNVTGYAAERLGRQWIGVELNSDYVNASKFRFERPAAEAGSPKRRKKVAPEQEQLPLP